MKLDSVQSTIFSFRNHDVNHSVSIGIQNMPDTRQIMFVSMAVFVLCLFILSVWNVRFQSAGAQGGNYLT